MVRIIVLGYPAISTTIRHELVSQGRRDLGLIVSAAHEDRQTLIDL